MAAVNPCPPMASRPGDLLHDVLAHPVDEGLGQRVVQERVGAAGLRGALGGHHERGPADTLGIGG
jgi:hypothetical protein